MSKSVDESARIPNPLAVAPVDMWVGFGHDTWQSSTTIFWLCRRVVVSRHSSVVLSRAVEAETRRCMKTLARHDTTQCVPERPVCNPSLEGRPRFDFLTSPCRQMSNERHTLSFDLDHLVVTVTPRLSSRSIALDLPTCPLTIGRELVRKANFHSTFGLG